MFNLNKNQMLLSRFSLMRLLGQSEMGQVWQVRDIELGADVALRVLNPELTAGSAQVELLKNEYLHARRLVHPHVVRIFDFHQIDNMTFLSMEYFDGQDLYAHRRQHASLPFQEFISLLLPVIDALAYAHSLGIVHRDVKGSNILIDRERVPRLKNFGISSLVQAAQAASQTPSAVPTYSMSPQQCEGLPPHPADDIYALGVLLCELLTENPPFYPNITPDQIHQSAPPPVSNTLNTDKYVPAELSLLVSQMMAKLPEKRPQNMGEVAHALQNLPDSTQSTTIPPASISSTPMEKSPPKPQAKIITPLHVAAKEKKPVRLSIKQKNLMNLRSVSLGLIIMIAGGIVLLIFFSRNPIRTMPDATQDIASERALESSSFPAHLPAVQPEDVQSTVPITQEQQKAEEKTTESPRGQHVEAVIRLLASGTEHENNNRFSFAHADYREALRLDPDSEEALKAFNRVNKLIAAQAFQELMSSGFTALHNKNYGRARALFLEAQSLRPGSREVRNALAEVDAAFRIDRIESFQQKALAHAASESWEQALEAYRAVLKLDSAIQFAIQGKERSLKIIQAEKRLNYYLDKPEVLESDQYFDKATRLLKEADKIEPKGPRFQESLQKFDKLLALARTPVEVKIESDSMTKVIVYKVGNLGRFTLRQLKLRPGTYTVVGTRDGFKDVRHKILVKHGRGAVRITVKCSQKI